MTLDVTRLTPPVRRFGGCGQCPYLESGSPLICYSCARRDIVPLSGHDERCEVCDLPLSGLVACGNPLCSGLAHDRRFEWNYAIGMRSGVLKKVVDAYKFGGIRAWGVLLARLVVGFLDDQADTFRGFDLIIPSPGWTGTGASRSWDHAEEVVRWAVDAAGDRWPFVVDPVVRRGGRVSPLHGIPEYKRRRAVAENELRASLEVVRPSVIRRKAILVYDDLFTDGLTLREVARVLRASGAARVCGISLMRQPFRAGSAPS